MAELKLVASPAPLPSSSVVSEILGEVATKRRRQEPTVIIGMGRSEHSPQQFADKLQPKVAEFSRRKVEPEAWNKFASMLDFVSGDFDNDATFTALKAKLEAAKAKGTKGNRL